MQPKKDDKTDSPSPPSRWSRDLLHRWHSGNELSEAEIEALSLLYPDYTIEEHGTLKGLQGVEVLLDLMGPEEEKYGSTKEALQTAVELRLRQHGIKVNPSIGVLYINVTAGVDDESGDASVAVIVEFHQLAVLLINPKILTDVTTWQRSSAGLVGLDELKVVREYVQDCVDEFIHDYLAANPKEQSTTEKDKKPKDN